MKKFFALLLVFILSISIVSCVNTDIENEEDEATTPSTTNEVDNSNDTAAGSEAEVTETLELADSLRINFATGNNLNTITYQQTTPLTLPDGSVVTQGNLKPTWQYISEELGFNIEDVALQDQKASEMIDISSSTGFTDAVVYGGNGIAEKLMSNGAEGYFINLNDYLNYMPNFSAYLEANPNIATAITAYDGNIYYIPYAAEIDNYARVFIGRESWVTGLLDSTDALVDETATLSVQYEGYWDRNATNVIDLQNAQAADGSLTRDEALSTLLQYISETYPELEKPSDLYLNDTAKFDIDELVALWRVVDLSPKTLSKLTTGEVVEDAEITPYFFRYTKYREDVLRLANYFGGQRVYGSDSYSANLYLDENNELHFSYAEDDFLAAVEQIKDIYSEGLIYSEFIDTSNKDNIRTAMFASDENEGQRQFGFMTTDWITPTTVLNEDLVGILPPLTTIEGSGSDEFQYFIENTRVIKPDGWAISSASSETEINAAITLFDYMFSEEGDIVQNYGMPMIIEEDEKLVVGDEEYPKFTQWVFDSADELTSGDIGSFLRYFMGSQQPVGYQKTVGLEMQYISENGKEAWSLFVDKDVLSTSYDAENPLFRLVPPVFSLTPAQSSKLNTLSIGSTQVDEIFLYITGAEGAIDSAAAIKDLYIESGIEDYVNVYQEAYDAISE
jgi:hypothetical protein